MKVIFILFAILFSHLTFANPLTNIVVFGDSISDNGNLYKDMGHTIPASPPYFLGHFSNGPIWVEHLGESYFSNNYNSHLLDYAYGGAAISEEESDVLMTLKREIDKYFKEHPGKADKNNLYIVWMGANNYLGVAENPEEVLKQVNSGIVSSLKRLAEAGAENIMVINLPNLGKMPIAAELDLQKSLTYFSRRHNQLLLNAINQLKATHPEVKWIYFDIAKKMRDLLKFHENYGITNITDTCYTADVDKTIKNSLVQIAAGLKLKAADHNCEGYFFFDPLHPTSVAHKLLADQVRAVLDEEGVEFAS